ncbi:hypothetical protein PRIC1_012670 [Phytophthora ramorum]
MLASKPDGKRACAYLAPSEGGLTKWGNKKRVRRIHVELSLHRQQVQELELKLKRLKLQKSQSVAMEHQDTCRDQLRTTAGSEAVSVWNAIAERQFQERLRAQSQQKRLRDTQTQLTQFSTELLKLLEKCGSREKLVGGLTVKQPLKFWELAVEADHELFAEQLASVARLRLELQQGQAPGKTMNFDWGLCMGNVAVKRNPSANSGVALEMHCGMAVPFNLQVAARAYWRFFCLEHGEVPSCDDFTKVPTDTIAQSFSIRLQLEGLILRASGKYTCQQYVGKDEVTIVWVDHTDVSEFGGIKFKGMQYQKRACIKMRRVPHEGPGEQSTSTVVEKHVETIPIFREGDADILQQTEAFINSANQTHNKLNKIVGQAMANLLLEEDWKATFG